MEFVIVLMLVSVCVFPDDVKLIIPTPITTMSRAMIATVAIRPLWDLAKSQSGIMSGAFDLNYIENIAY